MVKQLHLKLLLLLFMVLGGASAFAVETTITWNINGVNTTVNGSQVNTALKTSSVTGGSGSWTAVSTGSNYAGSSSGAQLGSSNYGFVGTLTLSESSIPSSATIKSIKMTASSSAGSGKPYTITAKVNNETLASKTVYGSSQTYTFSGSKVGNSIVLDFSIDSKKNVIITKLEVTYDGIATPSISAEDVDIAADASSGEIAYSINNPDGNSFSADIQSGDWISNVAVDSENSKVTFDVSENTGAIRMGSIRLTYGTITKDVTITQAAPVAKYTITIETPTNGTLVIKDGDDEVSSGSQIPDGTELTAIPTPNEGYKFRNWQAVDVSTHTYTANYTYKINGNDVTFKANFDKIVYHTITWSVNGKTTTEKVEDGTAVTFKTPTTNIPSGYTFMGWSAVEVEPQDEAPSYVTSASSTSDVTYYAVFAKGGEKEGWVKLDVDKVTEAGVYAIITTDGHAFNGSIASGHGQVTASAFSFVDGVAENTPTGTCEITFIASGNGFKMYNEDYGYLYASQATSGGLAWQQSENNYWMCYNSNWEYYKNYSGKYAYLRDYDNGSFRTYSSNNGSVIHFAHKTNIAAKTDFRTSVAPEAVSVSVSSAGLATYASDYDLDYTDVDGLEAYIAKDGENTITLKQVQKVPAGTGILLRATDGGDKSKSYSVPVTAETTDDMTGNLFVRGTGAAVATAGENSTNYILNIVDDVLGFYRAAGNTVATNRAYLQVPNGEGGETRAFIGINFDTNTGIMRPDNLTIEQSDNCYDLQGRRVNEPKHGLYIINGKKMFIK